MSLVKKLNIDCRLELHATTALVKPDGFNPTRIGLVFFQHDKLLAPDHGSEDCRQKNHAKLERDMDRYHVGTFVPTQHQVGRMVRAGFQFPDAQIRVRPKGNPESDIKLITNPALTK